MDYRGEIGVIVTNQGLKPVIIAQGDKIAQMVIAKHERVEWIQETLSETERGKGGFGSTTKLTPKETNDLLVEILSETEVIPSEKIEKTLDQTSKPKSIGKKNDSDK